MSLEATLHNPSSWPTDGPQVTCPKCRAMYPAGNVHHCATANLPSQVSPGQTCPRCGCWHNGVHVCGYPSGPLPQTFLLPPWASLNTCPVCREVYVGIHLCGGPALPYVDVEGLQRRLETAEAEVARLAARVAELEKPRKRMR